MKPLNIRIPMVMVGLMCVLAAQAQEVTKQNAVAAPTASDARQAQSETIIPRLIKFSGTLLDAHEHPVVGPVGVTFALYAQQNGGAALWLETQNVQPDANGAYTVLLGAASANGVPAELFVSGEARWLGIQVGQQPEHERILLVSVPYALKAGDAETLGGLPASAFVTTGAPGNSAAGVASASASPSSGAQSQSSTVTTPKKPAAAPNAATPCSTVTSDGTAAVNSIGLFTTACNVESSLMTQTLVNGFPGVNLAGNNAGLLLSGTGTHEVTVTGSSSSGRLGQDAQGFFFASDTNGKVIKFDTNNGTLNEWMRITSAGNVGIGTTTPAATLDVASTASSGNLFRVVGPTGGLTVQSNGTSPNIVAGFSGNKVGTQGGDTVSGGGMSGAINTAANTDVTVGFDLNTVGGGGRNTASNGFATVSGGWTNTASNGFAAVGGGEFNVASGQFATVGGGFANTASGQLATVSGGNSNTAQGASSFAAGITAKALHDATFVWNDGTGTVAFSSTAPNQFLIHAKGGVGIGTGSPSHQLEVVDAGSTGLRVQTNTAGGTVASFGGNGDFQIDASGVVGGRLIVKEGGNIGIGTATPGAKVDILGDGTNSPAIRVSGAGSTGGSGEPSLLLQTTDTGGPTTWSIRAGSSSTIQNLRFGTTSASDLLNITPAGRVGIGTTVPDNTLSVNGTADKPGGGFWNSFSDGRLKDLHGSFESGLRQVLRLHPVRYQYKEENGLGIHDSEEHVGLVAQEVQRVIPEAVTENNKGYLLVNNDPILWSMLNAIKEQQREIERLSGEVRKLRKAQRGMTQLQARLANLESQQKRAQATVPNDKARDRSNGPATTQGR